MINGNSRRRCHSRVPDYLYRKMNKPPLDSPRNNSHHSRPTTLAVILAVAAAFSAPIASAQSSGLVAAYSFDEGSGTTAADKSGNGNNGTLTGGTSWSSTAKFGTAASFDGSNDRI